MNALIAALVKWLLGYITKSISFFQCVVGFCKKELKCPHPGCSSPVSLTSQTIQWFEAILDEMFCEYKTTYTTAATKGPEKEILNITVLNGDAIQIPYNPTMTISKVRSHIQEKLNISPTKQKILFEDKEVQVISFLYSI